MSSSAKALVLGGKTGLLGQALVHTLKASGWSVSVAGPQRGANFDDSATTKSLEKLIDSEEPELIFNTIAYTQVDAAEDDIETASFLNRSFPTLLGRVVKERGCRLVHYSTDFVFDGKGKEPYRTMDKTNPENIYAKSKLEGEESLLSLGLAACTVIRSAWLFGPFKKNFITSIFDICQKNGNAKVIHDNIGSPTYTMDLALYSLNLVEAGGNGLFHVVNSGSASWCDLAAEAVRLRGCSCVVHPIESADFPQKAKRPAYSVLDNENFIKVTGISPRPWTQALCDYIYRYVIPEQI